MTLLGFGALFLCMVAAWRPSTPWLLFFVHFNHRFIEML